MHWQQSATSLNNNYGLIWLKKPVIVVLLMAKEYESGRNFFFILVIGPGMARTSSRQEFNNYSMPMSLKVFADLFIYLFAYLSTYFFLATNV